MSTAFVILSVVVILLVFNPDPEKIPKRRRFWNGYQTD